MENTQSNTKSSKIKLDFLKIVNMQLVEEKLQLLKFG